MDIIYSLILGCFVCGVVIGLIIGFDTLADKLCNPLYSRINNKFITCVLMGLLIPMLYGAGALTFKIIEILS